VEFFKGALQKVEARRQMSGISGDLRAEFGHAFWLSGHLLRRSVPSTYYVRASIW
jgi:hypothetical protein